MAIRIKKGLDLPISGAPRPDVEIGRPVKRVALVGDDYPGMKPTMLVAEGDRVKLGQPVFTDKKNEGVTYTSPGCGTVLSVKRGAKRKFLALVIELDGDEEESFDSFSDLSGLNREQVRDGLAASGLWTALRSRPFNRVPTLATEPSSIFVTAMDTRPLACDPAAIIAGARNDFVSGLHAITKLAPRVFVCKTAGAEVPGAEVAGVQLEEFSGPHPAGLPGTHIHFLDPVSANKSVWSIDAQEVIAIGRLFTTGRLSVERIVSLAGPSIQSPRLIRTRLGASTFDLVDGELKEGTHRIISGSVLGGRTASGDQAFLGRYHQQLSCLLEGEQRELLGWHMPGFDKFSLRRVFAAAWTGKKSFDFTTNTNGSPRAMVPIGVFEDVMPLDILPTFLLRALIVGDTEQAQKLGCLELDEEDLALCTFVCPGKTEYGPLLRKNLDTIEKEG